MQEKITLIFQKVEKKQQCRNWKCKGEKRRSQKRSGLKDQQGYEDF